MGVRGPLAAPEHPTELAPVDPAEVQIPQPPSDVEAETLERWETFWRSGLSRVVEDVDLAAVTRLFRYYDEWSRVERMYRSGDIIVEGSRGQESLHPLGKRLIELEGVIQQLEAKVGITALARARLGLTIGAAQLTWQQVARGGGATVPDGTVIDIPE